MDYLGFLNWLQTIYIFQILTVDNVTDYKGIFLRNEDVKVVPRETLAERLGFCGKFMKKQINLQTHKIFIIAKQWRK